MLAVLCEIHFGLNSPTSNSIIAYWRCCEVAADVDWRLALISILSRCSLLTVACCQSLMSDCVHCKWCVQGTSASTAASSLITVLVAPSVFNDAVSVRQDTFKQHQGPSVPGVEVHAFHHFFSSLALNSPTNTGRRQYYATVQDVEFCLFLSMSPSNFPSFSFSTCNCMRPSSESTIFAVLQQLTVGCSQHCLQLLNAHDTLSRRFLSLR